MKKSISILMVTLLLLISMVSGCGKKETSKTVLWFNATYAPLIKANKGDFRVVGGFAKNDIFKEVVKQLLVDSWEIENRQDAVEMVDYLLQEGHRKGFNEEMTSLLEECKGLNLDITSKEFDDLLETMDNDSKVSLKLMKDAYTKYGEHAIDAWDYCRVMQLLGYFYVADYYTYEEALDKSLEVAAIIQQTYSSWDDLTQSYLYGYQYWQEDDINDTSSASYARKIICEEIKNSSNSPYKLDWNTTLQKDW